MNVAILHFHLRRGGVTSVVLRQAACLASRADIRAVLVAGTAPEVPAPVPAYTVPGLDYDSFTNAGPGETPRDLADAVEAALRQAFPDGCDLLHVHNPLLRKNRRFLVALKILQGRGLRLLVQVHDFAEDFRPAVYEPEEYPQGCAWAVINPRDRRYLIAAGLAPAQVHYLPNPVSDAAFNPRGPETRGRRTALYPVRAIRRKNLGEAVLLSRFLPEGTRLAVTLPPTSPADRPAYDEWRRFVGADDRVVFEAGLHDSLDDLYARSFCAVTTSVKEGFGYSYLEPLVRGLPVAGRALPVATELFEAEGLRLDLYSALLVPRSAVPEPQLQSAVDDRLAALAVVFQPLFGEQEWTGLRAKLRARFEGLHLDFGALDETLQADVLRRCADPRFVDELAGLNPALGTLFDDSRTEADVLTMREAVLDRFSEERYGQRLAAAYGSAAPDSGTVDKARLAALFLDPSSFFLTAS